MTNIRVSKGKASASAKTMPKPLAIYSCNYDPAPDHLFICASSRRDAEKLYVEYNSSGEGAEGFTKIKKICELPVESNIRRGVVKHAMLKSIGFRFLRKHDYFVFRYKGKIYHDKKNGAKLNAWTEKQWPIPSVYLVKEVSLPFVYKIGFTKNLSRRDWELHRPMHPLIFVGAFSSPDARNLEKQLLKHLCYFSVGREWFQTEEWGSGLLELLFRLYKLEFSDNRPTYTDSYKFEDLVKDITDLVKRADFENYQPSKVERQSFEKLKGIVSERDNAMGMFLQQIAKTFKTID